MTDSGAPSPTRTPITVFLLDDHEVVRRGVHDLLDAEPDLNVVGEAGTAEQALIRIPALRPQVAVLDVRLQDGDGVSVCRELRSRMPELACLMLTSFDDEEALLDAVMAGASGYVLKQITGTDLVTAVRTIAAGQSMLDPGATTRLMARMRGDMPKEEQVRACPASPTGRRRSSSWSARGSPTGRSASGCTSRRKPSRTSSRACSPSWVWSAASKPP